MLLLKEEDLDLKFAIIGEGIGLISPLGES